MRISSVIVGRSFVLLLSAFLVANSSVAEVTYYVTDDLQNYENLDSFWFINGERAPRSPVGLNATTSVGTSYITRVPSSPRVKSQEVAVTLSLLSSGGAYSIYLEATPEALLGPKANGSFYAFVIKNPVFLSGGCTAAATLYKVIGGITSEILSTKIPCEHNPRYRATVDDDKSLHLWFAGVDYLAWTDPHPLDGVGGVGGSDQPTGNGVSQVQIGPGEENFGLGSVMRAEDSGSSL